MHHCVYTPTLYYIQGKLQKFIPLLLTDKLPWFSFHFPWGKSRHKGGNRRAADVQLSLAPYTS